MPSIEVTVDPLVQAPIQVSLPSGSDVVLSAQIATQAALQIVQDLQVVIQGLHDQVVGDSVAVSLDASAISAAVTQVAEDTQTVINALTTVNSALGTVISLEAVTQSNADLVAADLVSVQGYATDALSAKNAAGNSEVVSGIAKVLTQGYRDEVAAAKVLVDASLATVTGKHVDVANNLAACINALNSVTSLADQVTASAVFVASNSTIASDSADSSAESLSSVLTKATQVSADTVSVSDNRVAVDLAAVTVSDNKDDVQVIADQVIADRIIVEAEAANIYQSTTHQANVLNSLAKLSLSILQNHGS